MIPKRLPPRPHQAPQKKITRRDALLLLGGMGAFVACGGTASLAWLLAQYKPTNTPQPTPDMLITADSPTQTPAISVTESGYAKPTVVTRAEWGALAPNFNARYENGFYSADNTDGWYTYPDYRHNYQTLVVHHSVIYADDDVTSLRDVQNLHLTDRGWADVGYHFLVGKEGAIYEGRNLEVRGTHVAGYNTGSVGVCLLGNTSVDGVPDIQWQALGQICFWLRDFLSLTHLAGHRDFNPQTECPGNTMYFALDQLATALDLTRGIEGYIPQTPEPTSIACACGCCVENNLL